MIKIALKHFIYEICIDMVFNNISKNFKIPKKIIWKVGDMYECIATRPNERDIFLYIHAKVLEIRAPGKAFLSIGNLARWRKLSWFGGENEGLPTDSQRHPVHNFGGVDYLLYNFHKNTKKVCDVDEVVGIEL